MISLEEDLDMINGRIAEIDKNIALLESNMNILHDQLKETQKYIIRLAQNQAVISKRISAWPYIAVPEERQGDTDFE